MTKSGSERRKVQRISVTIPSQVFLKNGQTVKSEILDISEGGAFIHCTTFIKIGEYVKLKILFDQGELLSAKVVSGESDSVKISIPTEAKSVVRWVRGSERAGFGVEFLDLQEEEVLFLRKLVDFFHKHQSAG